MAIDYQPFVERIIEILKANADFAEKVSEFRVGDLPGKETGNSYPLVYATTPPNPEVSRKIVEANDNPSRLPGEEVVLEFWCVIVVDGADPSEIQKNVYSLAYDAQKILEKNLQLLDSSSQNRLCATSRIYVQGRLEYLRGNVVEAAVLRVRPTVYDTHQD